ncbi:MAG: hypothetical protein AAF773_04160 [Cyanobacteria bacterium P01_D01_bin.115]
MMALIIGTTCRDWEFWGNLDQEWGAIMSTGQRWQMTGRIVTTGNRRQPL